MDERHVAAYREEWVGNALGMVPPAPPAGLSQAFYDQLLRSALEEVHAEYGAWRRGVWSGGWGVVLVGSCAGERVRVGSPGPRDRVRTALPKRSWRIPWLLRP